MTTKRSGGRRTATTAKKGLSAKTFKGLNQKRIDKKGGVAGIRVPLKENNTVPIQFVTTPDEFAEFEVHVFQEDGNWNFVPCAGDMCPLCVSEDEGQRRTSYRFVANVYNLEAKKMQVLEGPQSLAGQIMYRYQRNTSRFLRRTYDVTRFATTPTSYGFELGEEDLIQLKGKTPHDLDEYITDQMKRYYGEDLEAAATSLNADDDDEDEWDEDDEFDEDEDEDEDYDPPARKKSSSSRSRRRR